MAKAQRPAVTSGARIAFRALLVAGVLLGAGCGADDPDREAGRAISKRLVDFARARRPLSLLKLTDAQFDRLVVISGRADADEYTRELDFSWDRADDLEYHCCDPVNVWAFVRDHTVIAYFRPSIDAGYGERIAPGSYDPSTRISWRPRSGHPRVFAVIDPR